MNIKKFAIISAVFIAVLFIVWLCVLKNGNQIGLGKTQTPMNLTVVIDAGHGGEDTTKRLG